MADCEDNIPPWRGTLSEDWEAGQWIGAEHSEDAYYRITVEVAEFYGITLCDEPEAALIALMVANNIRLSGMNLNLTRGDSPDDWDIVKHMNFLDNYLNLHGLGTADIANERIRNSMEYVPSGSLQTAYDYLFNDDYDVSKQDVIDEIRRLVGIHSIPTPEPTPADIAALGGLTILGLGFGHPSCVPGDATAFRRDARRNANGRYSRAAAGSLSGGSATTRYQINKCGRREYSLRNNATPTSHAPLADGLAPTPPPAAKAGYKFACCILEAKYIRSPDTSFYQAWRHLRRHYSRGPARLLRGPQRRAYFRGQKALWEGARGTQLAQMSAYTAAISDPDIPYWTAVYICSRRKARNYYRSLIRLQAAIGRVFACESDARRPSQNWKV